MPDTTEAQDIITTAQEAVDPVAVRTGDGTGIYLVRDHDGSTTLLDLTAELEALQAHPNRKTGKRTVSDVDSLVGYLAKHGLPQTELWGNPDPSTICAVINAHETADAPDNGRPGWGDHAVTLDLKASKDWTEWVKHDGRLMGQADFAEFIEDHLPNFVTPSGADMLELAQTFQATTRVDFDSSQRLKSGETQVTYKEDTNATAGKKGSIAIPDTFTIGLQVYERGDAYKVDARFRYRLTGGQLQLGYRLTRPRDVLLTAFDEVVAKVTEETGRAVWLT